jgi:hypothetical protein
MVARERRMKSHGRGAEAWNTIDVFEQDSHHHYFLEKFLSSS